jgi:hypothetical protein
VSTPQGKYQALNTLYSMRYLTDLYKITIKTAYIMVIKLNIRDFGHVKSLALSIDICIMGEVTL